MTRDIEKILFLDIETVPQVASLGEFSDEMQQLWNEKSTFIRERNAEKYQEVSSEEIFFQNAGIYSEFGRIICISVGFFHSKNGKQLFRKKSFASDNEKELLEGFSSVLQKFMKSPEYVICGHNIKEFDIPFICRRMLINRLPLPKCLQISGKKPWETPFVDTMELWRFGDYKNYTSLKLLTAVFGIPTPKDDIDGSQVATVYYKEKNLQRIAHYCEKDVLATARLYLAYNNLPSLDDDFIEPA